MKFIKTILICSSEGTGFTCSKLHFVQQELGTSHPSQTEFHKLANANLVPSSEGTGFEPAVPGGTLAFQASPFDHSGTLPCEKYYTGKMHLKKVSSGFDKQYLLRSYERDCTSCHSLSSRIHLLHPCTTKSLANFHTT